MSKNVRVTDRIKPFTNQVLAGVEVNLTTASWYFVADIIRGMGSGTEPGVVTGRMLQSITQVRVRPLEHWVGSTIQPRSGQKASYPYYHELGYRTRSGRIVRHPWLRPSLDRSKGPMLKIMGRDVTR